MNKRKSKDKYKENMKMSKMKKNKIKEWMNLWKTKERSKRNMKMRKMQKKGKRKNLWKREKWRQKKESKEKGMTKKERKNEIINNTYASSSRKPNGSKCRYKDICLVKL